MGIKSTADDTATSWPSQASFAESPGDSERIVDNVDHLHRKLNKRQIQMMTIGGTIGTALFISISYGLIEGGPGSLLLGFLIYSTMSAATNNCLAEVSTKRGPSCCPRWCPRRVSCMIPADKAHSVDDDLYASIWWLCST
jgi:amino acid permease